MATSLPASETVLSQNIRWLLDEHPLPAATPEEWEAKGKEEFKYSRMIGAGLLEGLIEQVSFSRLDQRILLTLTLRDEEPQRCSVEGNNLSTMFMVIVTQILARLDPQELRAFQSSHSAD